MPKTWEFITPMVCNFFVKNAEKGKIVQKMLEYIYIYIYN